MKTALLIVDVQHALCTGEWAMHDIGAVIDRINAVSARARAAGLPVVIIQHEESDPGGLVHGSQAWQLDARLTTSPDDLRVRKTTPDSFHMTPLPELLEARGIDRVIVCGLQSDYCIDSTTRGALARGYSVLLVKDGHSTIGNGVLEAPQIIAHHNRTLAGMDSFGPRVTLVAAEAVEVEA